MSAERVDFVALVERAAEGFEVRLERTRDEERRRREERDAEDAKWAHARAEDEAIGRLRRLERCGVPAKDVELLRRGEFADTPALEAAREYVARGGGMLVLSGPRGCGKTTAASWIIANPPPRRQRPSEQLAEELGREVAWTRDGDPVFLDVSRLSRVSRYRDDDMAPLEAASLLVIDDLGMEFADERGSFLATLDGVVNSRYADQRHTVLTTNLPAKAFKQRYGERLADRIREAGRFVECAGASLRGGL